MKTRENGRKLKLGVVANEFFDASVGRFGGFGWATRQVARFFTARPELGVEVVFLSREMEAEDNERQLIFAPRTNVAETETEYEVTVDLPGMKPEDLDVELKDGHLWITGERKHEEEEKGKTYHRIERSYGHFRRVIPLEESVNPEKVDAEYKDGVLHITVAKDEAAQPRKIPVKPESHE